MATEKCTETAKFVVPWADKTLLYCERHTREIKILGQAIGTTLQVRPITTLDKCEQVEEVD